MRCLLLLLLVSVSLGAQMFTVVNADKHYSQAEAEQAYKQATDAVAQEFHLLEPARPTFTLYLSEAKDSAAFSDHSLRLKRWDKRLFRQGVIFLSLVELSDDKNVQRLERHIEAQEAATVSVETLKK